EPTCAATPRQFRDPGRSLSWVCRSHARDERPRHETQVGMVDAFAACLNLLDGHLSDTSLLCPPNRVELRIGGRHQLEFMVGLGWNMQVWLQWLELARSGAFLQSSSAGEAFRELTGQL